ncbi:methyltransferase family protein [Bacteroidota bacterium]
MIKLMIFVICSLIILIISWKPLKDLSSHGFYRFFAFELIIVLFLINIDYWLYNPLSAFQIIAWFLLFMSIYPGIAGFYLLRKIGKPDEEIKSETNYKFEKTTKLVAEGIYKHIRHPMYASLLYLGWGIYFKQPGLIQILLAVVISIFLFLTAKVEEKENVEKFGDEYNEYIKRSKMFVHYIF